MFYQKKSLIEESAQLKKYRATMFKPTLKSSCVLLSKFGCKKIPPPPQKKNIFVAVNLIIIKCKKKDLCDMAHNTICLSVCCVTVFVNQRGSRGVFQINSDLFRKHR